VQHTKVCHCTSPHAKYGTPVHELNASPVHHQCITSASPVHHQCITSASPVHHHTPKMGHQCMSSMHVRALPRVHKRTYARAHKHAQTHTHIVHYTSREASMLCLGLQAPQPHVRILPCSAVRARAHMPAGPCISTHASPHCGTHLCCQAELLQLL